MKGYTIVGQTIECDINNLDFLDKSLKQYDLIYGCFAAGYCLKGVVPLLDILRKHLKEKGVLILKEGIITEEYEEDTESGYKNYTLK